MPLPALCYVRKSSLVVLLLMEGERQARAISPAWYVLVTHSWQSLSSGQIASLLLFSHPIFEGGGEEWGVEARVTEVCIGCKHACAH